MGWFKTLFFGGPTDKRLGIIKTVIEVAGTIGGAAIAGQILKKQLSSVPEDEALPEEIEVENDPLDEVVFEEETETEETK